MSTRRHVIYNAIGKLAPLLISIVTIPLLLNAVGESKYGLLSIVLISLSYFGLLDLGFGTAVAKMTSSEQTKNDTNQQSAITSSALAAISVTGVVGAMMLSFVAANLFKNLFDLTPTETQEIDASVTIISLILPIVLLSSILNGVLVGSKRFLELNIVAIATQSMVLLLPLIAAIHINKGLDTLIFAVLIARLLGLSVQLYVILTKTNIRLSLKAIKIRWIKNLLKYGGWVSVSGLISPIMTSADRMVIGNQLGLGAVTAYSIPYQLTSKTTVLAASVSEALFPRISGGTEVDSKFIADKSILNLIAITGPLVLIGILLSKIALTLWISEEFALQAIDVTNILLVGFWINGLATIPFVALQSRGRPNLVAYFHSIEVLPYLILLYFGITYIGIEGAAMAFTARVAADFFLLAFGARINKKIIGLAALSFLIISLTATAIHFEHKFFVATNAIVAVFAAAMWYRREYKNAL